MMSSLTVRGICVWYDKTMRKILVGIFLIGTFFSAPNVHAQTVGDCQKQMYWQLATPPYSATIMSPDEVSTGYTVLGPWHRSDDPQYTTNNTLGATTFDHYLRIKDQGDITFGPWEMEECTTDPVNGDKCTVPTLVRKPFIQGSTECGFESGGAFSPPNRIDDGAPICGATWSQYDANGNTTLSGSSDALSGLADTNNYTCNAAAGSTCSVTIYDNAGNSATCANPSKVSNFAPPSCSADASPVYIDPTSGVATANFTAAKGNGSFSWSAPGGNPASAAGQQFSTTYSSVGTQTVTVTSGTQFNQCSVDVLKKSGRRPICTDPNSITVTSNVPATWEIDGLHTGAVYTQTSPATTATYTVDPDTYGIITRAADGSWPTSVRADPPSQTITDCGQTITFTLEFNPPIQQGQTTINVRSNISTNWTITGPQIESGSGTNGSYSNVLPGVYSIFPADNPDNNPNGYDITVRDASGLSPASSQNVNNGGSITFDIVYTPRTAACDATLTIDPPIKTISVGQNTAPDYKAWYDDDGASCPDAPQNVSAAASWTSSNPAIAQSSGGGVFTGLRSGSVNVMASFAGLSASAVLNVTNSQGDFACVVTPNNITLPQGDSRQGTVTCSPIGNFNYPITFVPQNLPQATGMGFTPNPITMPTVSTYTFSAGPSSIPGTYGIFVAATANGITHTYPVTVTITGAPPIPQTHAECVQSACVQVAGAGADRCRLGNDADCGGGGGGGGGNFHGECNPIQKACVNVAGAGASSCSTDPRCGGTGDTHLECENDACVIVGGAGVNANGCTTVGGSCKDTGNGGPVNCTIKANPAIIKKGDTSTLTWSCTGNPVCTIIGPAVVNVDAANSKSIVKPPQTSQYQLSCNDGAYKLPVSVYVVESYKETNPGK